MRPGLKTNILKGSYHEKQDFGALLRNFDDVDVLWSSVVLSPCRFHSSLLMQNTELRVKTGVIKAGNDLILLVS